MGSGAGDGFTNAGGGRAAGGAEKPVDAAKLGAVGVKLGPCGAIPVDMARRLAYTSSAVSVRRIATGTDGGTVVVGGGRCGCIDSACGAYNDEGGANARGAKVGQQKNSELM